MFFFTCCWHPHHALHRLPPPRPKLPPLFGHPCPPSRLHRRQGETTITAVCRHSQISPIFYLVTLQLCRLSNMDTLRHVLQIKLNHVPTCLVVCSRKTMPPFHLLTSLPVSSQGSRCQPCRISFPPNSISAQAVRTAATMAYDVHGQATAPDLGDFRTIRRCPTGSTGCPCMYYGV